MTRVVRAEDGQAALLSLGVLAALIAGAPQTSPPSRPPIPAQALKACGL